MTKPTVYTSDEPGFVRRLWSGFRKRAEARRTVDNRWMRILLTLLALVSFGVVIAGEVDAKFEASLTLKLAAALLFHGTLMLYFARLLAFKLRVGLAEHFAALTLGGTLSGLVLSMPGLLDMPLLAALLCAGLAAWVAYGAAKGVLAAIVLGHDRTGARMLHLVLGWWRTASPTLIVWGVVAPETEIRLLSPLQGWLVLVLGVVGIVLGLWIDFCVERRARTISRPVP